MTIDRHKFGPWAIVTGASSGIGLEFARQLAADGLNLVLVARRGAVLEEIGAELSRDFGVDHRAVAIDLTDPAYLEVLDEATRDLDVGLLVGNAGSAVPGEFLSGDRERFLACIQLKVVANLLLVHHFGPRLAARGRGGVLLVSSVGGLQGVGFVANNAATEAYVLALGEGLHDEFRRSGLHMTVLLPGPTATPGMSAMVDPATMYPKPMSAAQCASEGLAALAANRATHIAGRTNRLMFTLMPRSVASRMMGAMIGRMFAGGVGAPTKGRARRPR